MVTQSPYEPIQPTIFFTDGYLGVFVIRLNPTVPVREGLAEVEKVFRKYNPDAPFEYSFVDEVYGRKFANEERIANLTAVFAILAVLISCLGLFGLASFVAEQRTKEIGIRKILGATIANLWKLLSMDFIVLVIISFSVAIPLSAYFMQGWLMQFPYRMTMSWQLFAAVILGVLALILVTVSYQAVRAAIANPIKSLRSE